MPTVNLTADTANNCVQVDPYDVEVTPGGTVTFVVDTGALGTTTININNSDENFSPNPFTLSGSESSGTQTVNIGSDTPKDKDPYSIDAANYSAVCGPTDPPQMIVQ